LEKLKVADLKQKIETLAQWMLEAQYLVVFTGAGISTESGIRDFRGPDGLWTRRDKGLATPEQDWTLIPVTSLFVNFKISVK
jgi:NAD-dependent SIR2 family protein deacetylase